MLAALAAALLIWRLRPRKAREEAGRFRMPDPVTPFSVLGLLRDIEQNDGLTDARKHELAASIRKLEAHYFAEPAPEEPDLHEIAQDWIRRTS